MNITKVYGFLIVGFVLLGLLNSCSNEEDCLYPNNKSEIEQDIMLQKRGTSLPKLQTYPLQATQKEQTRGISDNGELIGNSDILLGYSYSVGDSFLGNMENVRFPVLNLDKIKSKYPTAITRKQLTTSSDESFTYNGMSRYEEKSQISKTVKTGFSLNLGIFKIGREKKLTELFKSNFNSTVNCVCGELNIEVKNGQYELLATESKRKDYIRECLTSTFQTDLYRGTIGNLLDSYGHFVLRSYITGGKAMALYVGQSTSFNTSEEREKALDKDISASFSWKSDSASGNLTFGKNNGSGSSQTYSTVNTKVYIKTFGGTPTYQVSVGPTDLKSLSVDLTAWRNSLTNKSTNTLIDITSGTGDGEGGLYPLSDFVIEKNFRYRMDDTTLGLLDPVSDILYPRFEIVKVLARTTSSGEQLYEIAPVLNTRQGDKIVLSNGAYLTASDSELRANNNNQTMMNKVQEIFAQKKTIFTDLEFTTNYSTKYNPDVRKPLVIRLDGFDESKMSVFKDSVSKMTYICNPSKKIALAYKEDEEYGDYIPMFYGIQKWVDSLPTLNSSLPIIHTYTIIGL